MTTQDTLDMVDHGLETAEDLSSKVDIALDELNNMLPVDQTPVVSALIRQARHDNRETGQCVHTARLLLRRKEAATAFVLASSLLIFALSAAWLLDVPEPALAAEVPAFEESFNAGIDATNQQNYEEAIKNYESALKREPESVTTMQELAYAHYCVRNDKQAIEVCGKMKTIQPDAARAYFIRGLIHKRLGEWYDALDEFRQAAHYGDRLATFQIKDVEKKLKPF